MRNAKHNECKLGVFNFLLTFQLLGIVKFLHGKLFLLRLITLDMGEALFMGLQMTTVGY